MLFSTRFGRRLRLSVGAWMVLGSVLALVPLAAFSLLATYRMVSDHQAQALESLQRRAGVAADSVAAELKRHFAVLHTLAASADAMAGNVQGLHVQALKVVHAEHGIGSISLADPEGRKLFSTLRPFGAPLPPSGHQGYGQAVFERGADIVVPLVPGGLSGRPVVALAVPVVSGGQVTHVLALTISPDTVGTVLNQHRWPADWTASVTDQQRVIVARSHDGERFVGQPVTPSLRQRLDAQEHGVFESVTKDGVAVVTAIAPVGGTGWFVSVGRPLAAMQAERRNALLPILLAGLLCALLAAGGSWYLSREVGREMRVRAADALEGAAGHSHGPVRELASLSEALGRARTGEQNAERRFEDARLDALTQLPARALLHERASRLLDAAASDPQRGAVVLFADLDGFKAVNDRLGHEEGDRVLVEVAQVLRRCVRESDLVGRLGGDEFVAVLAAAGADAGAVGREVAERVVAGVEGLGRGLGCSIGLAVVRPAETLEAAVARADAAMQAAKRAGKNRVETFEPA